MNHQVDHRNQDHAFTALRQGLVIFRQSAIFPEPCERPLNDPAFGSYDEPLRRRPFHDLHEAPEPAAGPIHKLAGVAAVGKDQLQSSPSSSQLPNDEPCPVPVLNIGRMDHQGHDQAQGVHDQMTLAAKDLLARIVPTIPPFSAVLTVWLSRIPTLGVGFFPALRRAIHRSR